MKVVILGAGISGLAAGYELQNSGVGSTIYEKCSRPGGLCKTEDVGGIPLDYGVHVIWGKPEWWGKFIEEELGVKLNWYDRNAVVQYKDRRVAYPFQYNLRDLPEDEMYECLIDFIKADKYAPINFTNWFISNFGEALSNKFFIPFNTKLYQTPLHELTVDNVNNIFVPKVEDLLRKVIFGEGQNYGGNVKIGYPVEGGIESVVRALSKNLNIKCNSEVMSIDAQDKKIMFKNGDVDTYDKLITSIPLNSGAYSRLFDYKKFECVRTYCTLVIMKETINKEPASWIYYPEEKYPFYRITPLGNIGLDKRALLVETSSKRELDKDEQIDLQSHILWELKGLGADITENKCFTIDANPAYTMNTEASDEVWSQKPMVDVKDLRFIGRYGLWKYASMHQAFETGIQAVKEII